LTEKTLLLGEHKNVVGIVTEPDLGARCADRPAVLLLNAGLIHRVGPNRIYVKLARQLAQVGYLTLRIDLSGIGDSQPRPGHVSIEKSSIADVTQAMDYLAEAYGSQSFVLMGHCAGAFHAFRTANQDRRVSGCVLINPEGGEPDWKEYDRRRKLATYQSNVFGRKKLWDPARWKRLLTGQVHISRLLQTIFKDLLGYRAANVLFQIRARVSPQAPSEYDRALFTIESVVRKMDSVPVRALLIYYEGSTSLERTRIGVGRQLRRLSSTGQLTLQIIPQADHLFTLVESQRRLTRVVLEWLQAQTPQASPQVPPPATRLPG